MDDQELFRKTAQGRDVNRHNYTPSEIAEALEQPVTKAIIALARVRKHSAFEGEFSWKVTAEDSMEMSWTKGDDKLTLSFAFKSPQLRITSLVNGESTVYEGVEGLASY
jgi:sucrose phosphorylase